MFTELHAMAKAAMLLITATAEGDQLRISISPTYPDGKVPAGAVALRPMSLIGTPDELNADFAGALAVWQAPPKRSILEQAQAAAEANDDAKEPAKAAGKAAAKPADAKPKGGKGGRKSAPAAQAQGDAAPQTNSDDVGQDDDDETSEAVAEPAPAPAAADAALAAPAAPAATEQSTAVVDDKTLDLF
jgi:PRTRC genetic system protein E